MKPVKSVTKEKEATVMKKVKPFGLSIGVKIALQAIQESVAPTSVVLSNLFNLQKSKVFPKDLNVDYFKSNAVMTTEIEKKAIMFLLEEFKKPGVQKQKMLEDLLEATWVKKTPQMAVPNKTTFEKPKNSTKKTLNKKPLAKKEVVAPVVVVKKPKISN